MKFYKPIKNTLRRAKLTKSSQKGQERRGSFCSIRDLIEQKIDALQDEIDELEARRRSVEEAIAQQSNAISLGSQEMGRVETEELDSRSLISDGTEASSPEEESFQTFVTANQEQEQSVASYMHL